MDLKKVSKETKNKLMGARNMDLDKFDKLYLNEGGPINIPTLSTGIDSLDDALGGGVALGQHIHIWGKEGSGKTLFAMLLAKQFQQADKKVLWADLEGSFNSEWANSWGLDTKKLLTPKNCVFGEQFMDLFIVRTIKNDVGLIVVDSIPKIVPKMVLDKMTGEKTMGSKPALLSLALDNIDTHRQAHLQNGVIPPTILWINQVRDKIGGYITGETFPGGHSISHSLYQNIKIKVKSGGYFTDAGKDVLSKSDPSVVGYTCEGTVMKNKHSKPNVAFDYRINVQDKEIDNLAYLIGRKKKFVRAGAWYKFDDKQFQGEANFRQYLKETPDAVERLKNYNGGEGDESLPAE